MSDNDIPTPGEEDLKIPKWASVSPDQVLKGEPEGPRVISDEQHSVQLTGCFVPFEENGQPVLLCVPGSDNRYIPIYANVDELRRCMASASAPFHKIARIDDAKEFMDSIPKEIKLAMGMRLLANGHSRWAETQR
jgi:hypothetical protein